MSATDCTAGQSLEPGWNGGQLLCRWNSLAVIRLPRSHIQRPLKKIIERLVHAFLSTIRSDFRPIHRRLEIARQPYPFLNGSIEAEFGIFIHWGIYSVPSWSPKRNTVDTTGEAYAEWYGMLMQRPERLLQASYGNVTVHGSSTRTLRRCSRRNTSTRSSGRNLFKTAGAQYVVLTAKHHDGFCLWPSEYAWNWNSVDIGPHRDLVGEVKTWRWKLPD